MPLISYATSYNRTTVNSHCLCAYCLERYDCTIFDYLLLLFLQEDTTKINKETLNGVQIVDFIQLEHSLERQRKKNGLRQFYAYVFFPSFVKSHCFLFPVFRSVLISILFIMTIIIIWCVLLLPVSKCFICLRSESAC